MNTYLAIYVLIGLVFMWKAIRLHDLNHPEDFEADFIYALLIGVCWLPYCIWLTLSRLFRIKLF